jgi:DNA-binding XRE family transcriptional regulator
MMISPGQIKAARAMMDWTQDMMAREVGVSSATVFKYEKGQISFASAKKIRQALESKGFEFIGTHGVNRAENTHITYSGPDGCHKFYDDILATAESYGGEISVIYKTPQLLLRSFGITNTSKLERLEKLKSLARIKCLLSDTKNAGCLAPLMEMRTISQHPFEPLALIMCGNSFTIAFPNQSDIFFYVTKSVDLANAEMINFMRHWNIAIPFVG